MDAYLTALSIEPNAIFSKLMVKGKGAKENIVSYGTFGASVGAGVYFGSGAGLYVGAGAGAGVGAGL